MMLLDVTAHRERQPPREHPTGRNPACATIAYQRSRLPRSAERGVAEQRRPVIPQLTALSTALVELELPAKNPIAGPNVSTLSSARRRSSHGSTSKSCREPVEHKVLSSRDCAEGEAAPKKRILLDGAASAPRWEFDLVAYKGSTNDCRDQCECKSYSWDSGGAVSRCVHTNQTATSRMPIEMFNGSGSASTVGKGATLHRSRRSRGLSRTTQSPARSRSRPHRGGKSRLALRLFPLAQGSLPLDEAEWSLQLISCPQRATQRCRHHQ